MKEENVQSNGHNFTIIKDKELFIGREHFKNSTNNAEFFIVIQ